MFGGYLCVIDNECVGIGRELLFISVQFYFKQNLDDIKKLLEKKFPRSSVWFGWVFTY